jgi:arylsulfatase A-like enzyme
LRYLPGFHLSRRAATALAAATLSVLVVAGLVYAYEKSRQNPSFAPITRGSIAASRDRPNVVFIYTDDQNASDFHSRYMPRTKRFFAQGGTTFTNYVVTTPICCPSRASMLSGQYAHNNGVYTNKTGYAGLRDQANTLAGWFQHAGYRTGWFGKFLQQYKRVADDPADPAPGFDDWHITLKPKYFDWKLYENGELTKGGDRPRDYFTDVLTERATSFIAANANADRPVFMVVNNLGPHRGKGGEGRCKSTVAPAPRDRKRFAGEPLPKPPSFNRPTAGQTAFPGEHLDAAAVDKERDRHRCRLESLAAVDRGVDAIQRAFAQAGELDNTIFVFTSDNGILQGQHGLTGKNIPYEEGLRMPLAIRVPQELLEGPASTRVTHLAASIDLAPTLLELAGATPCISDGHCRRLDGRSLVPLLTDPREGQWPSDRAVVIEGGEHADDCSFRGLRLEHEVLLEAVADAGDGGCRIEGSPELYDLRSDPYQLRNLAPERAGHVKRLQARLDRLEHCRGNGRGEDACD